MPYKQKLLANDGWPLAFRLKLRASVAQSGALPPG
jgi:hypothetical protein